MGERRGLLDRITQSECIGLGFEKRGQFGGKFQVDLSQGGFKFGGSFRRDLARFELADDLLAFVPLGVQGGELKRDGCCGLGKDDLGFLHRERGLVRLAMRRESLGIDGSSTPVFDDMGLL